MYHSEKPLNVMISQWILSFYYFVATVMMVDHCGYYSSYYSVPVAVSVAVAVAVVGDVEDIGMKCVPNASGI